MRRTALVALAIVALSLAGCGFVVVHTAKKAYRELTKDERDIGYALNRYRVLVTQGDFDKAAEMFDEGAELSHQGQSPVVGREAIRTFLSSFKGYKVIEYELEASSTSATGTKGKQEGTYHQKIVSPEGKAIEAGGSFQAEWNQQPGGAWLIHRLHTSASVE